MWGTRSLLFVGRGLLSQHPHQVQVALRLPNIAHDLLFQSLRRRPAPFLAQPAIKNKPERRLLLQLNRMKIEQMRFHRKRVRTESWPVTDVGHRIEPLPSYSHLRDVYAVWGQQLTVGRQVDGGN